MSFPISDAHTETPHTQTPRTQTPHTGTPQGGRLPPVAVLIDRDTGSSGEGIAIAFQGRPDTRFCGELTYGAA